MINGTAADHCDMRLSPRLVVEGDDNPSSLSEPIQMFQISKGFNMQEHQNEETQYQEKECK